MSPTTSFQLKRTSLRREHAHADAADGADYALRRRDAPETPQSDPALYRDASPIVDVSPQSAPTLIVQGTQDATVPPAQSQELQQALQQNGVAVQYISYQGGHGFSGLSADQLRAIELQTVDYLTAQKHP